MKIEIAADTIFYTEIAITDNANHEPVFKGFLKMEPDWWVLYDTSKDYMGDIVKKWRGSREHVAVLAAALEVIAKRHAAAKEVA